VRFEVHGAQLRLQHADAIELLTEALARDLLRREQCIELALGIDHLLAERPGACIHGLPHGLRARALFGAEREVAAELQHMGGPGVAVELGGLCSARCAAPLGDAMKSQYATNALLQADVLTTRRRLHSELTLNPPGVAP
jgi:hypothetical protein